MNTIFRTLALLAVIHCKSAYALAEEKADTVFTRGKVYTLDSQTPWAEAVAVSGGKIIYVGNAEEVKQYVDDKTDVIQLNGRLLLPGFIDTHMHPLAVAAMGDALQLDPYGDKQQWLDEIADYANSNQEKDLIFGLGFSAMTFGLNGPSKSDLDAIVADRPVIIADSGLHSFWVNSKALEKAGVTRNTQDPIPGTEYYARDEQGNPSGWIVETYDLLEALKPVGNQEAFVAGANEFLPLLSSFGITTAFDAGTILSEPEILSFVHNMAESNQLPLRIVAARTLLNNNIDTIITDVESLREQFGWQDMFKIGALKIPLDGTIEARNAAMHTHYVGEPENDGGMSYTTAELQRVVKAADLADIDVHIHAIGDRAIHEALNAIELAQQSNGKRGNRHTLCHVELMADEDLDRVKPLDVIIQTTPYWHAYSQDGEKVLGEEREKRKFRFNELINQGVKVTFGSDFPATESIAGLPPLNNIEVGHTRRSFLHESNKSYVNKDEQLGVAALVRGYTLDAAYQIRMEELIGSIEVGKRADLIVLDRNLLEIPAIEIHKIDVDMTMVDGKMIYTRPIYQWLIEWWLEV